MSEAESESGISLPSRSKVLVTVLPEDFFGDSAAESDVGDSEEEEEENLLVKVVLLNRNDNDSLEFILWVLVSSL